MTLFSSAKIDDTMMTFIDPNVNVYVYSGSSYTPMYYNDIGSTQHSSFSYNAHGTYAPDIGQAFYQPTIIGGLAMYEPMYLDVNDLTSNHDIYQARIGFYKPFTWVDLAPPVYKDSINVEYSYLVAKARFDENGKVESYYTERYYFEETSPLQGDYCYFYNYRDAHIRTIARDGATWDAGGKEVCWVMSINIGFDNVATEAVIYDPFPANQAKLYQDYLLYGREHELRILNGNAILDIEDVDVTSWLTNSVKSFMDFEVIPGLSFAGILAILLGIPLLVWFLRLFAGG